MHWRKLAVLSLFALAIGLHITFCRGGTNLPTTPVLVLHLEDIDAAGFYLHRGVFTVDWLSPPLPYLLGGVLPVFLIVVSYLLWGPVRVFFYTRRSMLIILVIMATLSVFPEAYAPIPVVFLIPFYSIFRTPDWLIPFVPFVIGILFAVWTDLSLRRNVRRSCSDRDNTVGKT